MTTVLRVLIQLCVYPFLMCATVLCTRSREPINQSKTLYFHTVYCIDRAGLLSHWYRKSACVGRSLDLLQHYGTVYDHTGLRVLCSYLRWGIYVVVCCRRPRDALWGWGARLAVWSKGPHIHTVYGPAGLVLCELWPSSCRCPPC
jgi:hypothetical protein